MLSINDDCAVPFKDHDTEDVPAVARSFRLDDAADGFFFPMPCVNPVLLAETVGTRLFG